MSYKDISEKYKKILMEDLEKRSKEERVDEEVQKKEELMKKYKKSFASVRDMITKIGKIHVARDKKMKEMNWGDLADLQRVESDLEDILEYWK